MLDEKQFEEDIVTLCNFDKYLDVLSKLSVNIFEEKVIGDIQNALVETLNQSLGLKNKEGYGFGTDLEYWIYELEFGNKKMNSDMDYIGHDLKKLYAYLTKERNN